LPASGARGYVPKRRNVAASGRYVLTVASKRRARQQILAEMVKRSKRFVKAELNGIRTYDELSPRLRAMGWEETDGLDCNPSSVEALGSDVFVSQDQRHGRQT